MAGAGREGEPGGVGDTGTGACVGLAEVEVGRVFARVDLEAHGVFRLVRGPDLALGSLDGLLAACRAVCWQALEERRGGGSLVLEEPDEFLRAEDVA